MGIGEKSSDMNTTTSDTTGNRKDSAMSSPVSSHASSPASKEEPAESPQFPEEKFASSSHTPRPSRGSDRPLGRNLTARHAPPSVAESSPGSDAPPDHVPDEAELERRRRGDAQPQVVPFEMMEMKMPASRDIADVNAWTDRRLSDTVGVGVG